jgi:hypothetical protein
VPRAVERQDRVESAATASPEYETAEAQVVRRFGVTTATLLRVDRLPVLVGSQRGERSAGPEVTVEYVVIVGATNGYLWSR